MRAVERAALEARRHGSSLWIVSVPGVVPRMHPYLAGLPPSRCPLLAVWPPGRDRADPRQPQSQCRLTQARVRFRRAHQCHLGGSSSLASRLTRRSPAGVGKVPTGP